MITINDNINYFCDYSIKPQIITVIDSIKSFNITLYINDLDYTVTLHKNIKYEKYYVKNYEKNKFIINLDINAKYFNYLSLKQDSIIFNSKRSFIFKKHNQEFEK